MNYKVDQINEGGPDILGLKFKHLGIVFVSVSDMLTLFFFFKHSLPVIGLILKKIQNISLLS